jgi:integral membrane sensor domain MASE1/class 3 adenylate cyclase
MSKAPYPVSQQNRKLVPISGTWQWQSNPVSRPKAFLKQYKNEYETTGIVVLSAIAYWAIAMANHNILDVNTLIPVWLPSGVALLLALWLGEPGLLGVGLGDWCLNLMLGYPLPSSILMTLAALLQVMAGKWLLARSADVFSFKHLRDILRPIFAAAIIPTLMGAVLTTFVRVSGIHFEAWIVVWLANCLGILAVVPLALAIARKRRLLLRLVQQRWLEAGLSLVFITGLSWVVFLSSADSIIHGVHPEFLVMGTVLWVALRLGLVGAWLSSATVLLFSSIGLKTLGGPFIAASTNHFGTAIVAHQLFLMLMLSSALLVATSETHLRATKQHLKNLGRYMAPRLLDEVAGLNLSLDLGSRQSVAILEIQIHGFSNMVEHLTPEAVLQIMREFHNRIGASVAQYHGFIQSRTTDGLVAVFGESQMQSHQPSTAALGCARKMIESLALFNTEQLIADQIPILASIGVDYGTVILDGSHKSSKQDFMIAGRVVKTVTGLRELCNRYQADICISQTLKDLVSRQSQDESILEGFNLEGSQRISGFSEPMTVWSLHSQMMEFYYGGSDFDAFEDQLLDGYDAEHIQSILDEAEQIHESMQKNNSLIPYSSPKP